MYPFRPEVTQHEVALPGLGEDADGLRVAQLSDLHRGAFVPRAAIRRAVERCNRLSPDLVVLTGDYVTGRAGYAECCAGELARLSARLGAFAVLGNHDHLTDAAVVERALTAHGIRMLTNRSVQPAAGLWLVGVDDSWTGRPDLDQALAGVPAEATPILLTHNPALCRKAMVRPLVVLCGHTHGGQVFVPGLTERMMSGIRSTGLLRGWYQQSGGLIYVNRGIGTVGLPVRFRARPEISLFTLRRSEAGEGVRVR